MSTAVLSQSPVVSRRRFRGFASETVRACYDVLDACRAGGIEDFTDGKYVDGRNDRKSYLAAQARQADFLIDQLACRPKDRILDIGCGYGRILRRAQERGLDAVGITLSPPQREKCSEAGLTALVLNYCDIFEYRGDAWEERFQGIVANGSLEHFVQVDDAATGRADSIYAEFFTICRRLVAAGSRLVTTAIHFREYDRVDPWEIRRGPSYFRRDTFERHYANLVAAFGGWYPEPGQLQRSAEGSFRLVSVEDGTNDYRLTSEFWLRQLFRSLITRPQVWGALAKSLAAEPHATVAMLRCLATEQSWNWQFRDKAPMQLLRQTWEAVD